MKTLYVGLLGIARLLATDNTLAASAEGTYKTACGVCHDAGVAGAPKLGDNDAWAPRIKQGGDVLYKSAVKGKVGTAMIAKGGFSNLSDTDFKAVVDLMLEKVK